MKRNYHTHTIRCNHAIGEDEEYVVAAISGGYKVLGFSDHSPWKYKSDFVGRIRMPLSKFDDYYQSITTLKEKYKEQIEIKIGLECEYFPQYMNWLKNFKEEKKLDYIILGNHFYKDDEYGVYYGRACRDDEMLTNYVNDCIEGMKTGLYAYLAHPDLFMRGRDYFDKHAKKESIRLLEACKKMGVVIEYNLEGMKTVYRWGKVSYPCPEFWELASKIGNKAIIGIDAHDPKSLEKDGEFERAKEVLKSLNIEIVEDIDTCYKLQKIAKSIDF